MYPTTILQWFFRDAWEEIGWRASTPRSERDLKTHGARLAANGGRYRLAYLSPRLGGEVEVWHTYPVMADV